MAVNLQSQKIQNTALNPLLGHLAIFRALEYLSIHVAFMIFLSAVLTGLAWLKASKDEKAILVNWSTTKFTSILAFSALGFCLAYLLSLGVTKDGASNSILTTIAVPLVPLLTGGITWLESANNGGQNKPRTSLIAFLITFVVCYQTFVYQISYEWPA